VNRIAELVSSDRTEQSPIRYFHNLWQRTNS
jgi:hypothetical protein